MELRLLAWLVIQATASGDLKNIAGEASTNLLYQGELYMKLIGLFLTMFLVISVAAQAKGTPFWGAKAPVAYETPTQNLKPGEFTWAPQLAPEGPILVVVSLDEQRAYAYRNGVEIGASTISSGKRGHQTPTGVFHTFLKDADHHSSLYHDAAMPYTQKFTQDGVALHAGGIPGYPESHGCVHLPSEFARLLFGVSPKGMTVVIANKKTAPASVDHPPLLIPVTAAGSAENTQPLAASEDYRWEPEKSPTGPVSMILSGYDKRIIVLRNGVEIGRSTIALENPGTPLGTHVFVMAQGKTGKSPSWIGLGITDHMGDANRPLDPDATKRVHIPDAFLHVLVPSLAEGSTLMVTDEPVLESTTGVKLSVLSSSPVDTSADAKK